MVQRLELSLEPLQAILQPVVKCDTNIVNDRRIK